MDKYFEMTDKELQSELLSIRVEISRRAEIYFKVELKYNYYKGTGKCWIARVNENKKILSFVTFEAKISRDNYSGSKVFLLGDGDYQSCESGSKRQDSRKYFSIC